MTRTKPRKSSRKGDIPEHMRRRVVGLARSELHRLMAGGLTQKQIEGRWGIAQSTISEWLGGSDKLGLGLMLRLREALHMTLDDLLGLPPLRVDASARELPPQVQAAVQIAAHAEEIAGEREPSAARVRPPGENRRSR